MQAFTGLPVAASIYGQTTRRTASIRTCCSWAAGRVRRRRATASPACSGRPRPPTPRSSCSRRACRCWCSRRPIVPDSGGAGRHRGGLGQRVRMRKLDDDGLPTLVSVYPEGVEQPHAGPVRRAGRRRGARPRARRGRPRRSAIAAPASSSRSTAGTRSSRSCLPAAPAIGDPSERAARTLESRRSPQGYVTPEGAARDYGFDVHWRRPAARDTVA